MSRRRFPGHALVDAALDIPIVLPPMVVGICLLIFFQTRAGGLIEQAIPLTYTVGGVIVAQFVIAAAFAIRTMRNVFDHLSPRPEQVALTLGATPAQAFRHVTLPAARGGDFRRRQRGLGAQSRRVRTHPCVRRSDPDENRGAPHQRSARLECRRT